MMLTGLITQIHKARFLLDHHSTTILTGIAVGGTVSTAILTGRASFKAAEILAEGEPVLVYEDPENGNTVRDLTRVEKIKLTWQLYIPPVATGLVSVTCMVVANKISSQKIAALAVAGGISERALQEYKDKVVEKLGERQNTAVRDEIAQDRVNANASGQEVILVGSGQVLCYDLTTDRYFQSTVEDIKRAENQINSELLNHMGASLAEFHDHIGLRPTNYTDSVGWGSPEMFKVIFSTVMSPDGRPCIAIDFERPPQLEYAQQYR